LTTLYKIFNPSTGEYSTVNSIEECIEKVGELAYNLYLEHVHNNPYSIVTVNEDGSETWRSADGTETDNYDEIQANITSRFANK
jgi:hypothetical protein